MIFTYAEIAALRPCWLQDGRAELLRTLVGDDVTARQIAEDERVSLSDRRWVLCHLLARGPRPNLRSLIEWAARIALDDAALITDEYDEGVARHAAELALRWSQGESISRDEPYAAYCAARAADAWAAAYVAYAAAYAAAAAARRNPARARGDLLALAEILDGAS